LIAQIVVVVGFLIETSVLTEHASRSPICVTITTTSTSKTRVLVSTVLGANAQFPAVQSCICEMFWREGATAFLPGNEQPLRASCLKLKYEAHPVTQLDTHPLHRVTWEDLPTINSHDPISTSQSPSSAAHSGSLLVSVDFVSTPGLRGLEDAIHASMEVLPEGLVVCTVRPRVGSNPSPAVYSKPISRTLPSPTATLRDMINGGAWCTRFIEKPNELAFNSCCSACFFSSHPDGTVCICGVTTYWTDCHSSEDDGARDPS
jgi:hypothetical protein